MYQNATQHAEHAFYDQAHISTSLEIAMDTPIAQLMCRLKNDIPILKPLWLRIWRAEIARDNRRYLREHAS